MAFSNPSSNLEQFGLSDGMTIADLGAGSGFYTLAAAHINKHGKNYAVDVQADILPRIKNAAQEARLKNVEVVHGNIEEQGGSKLKTASCDAVLSCNVLFQIENKEIYLSEIKRILKPGGRVLVIDWSDSFGGMGPQSAYIVADHAAKNLFASAGFAFIKNINAGDHHYGLVFRKD